MKFEKEMEAEHCSRFDSEQEIVTSNYQVVTTPKKEWTIVMNCDENIADMRHGRKLQKVEEVMKKPEVRDCKLSKAEVIAVILYTGPMVNSLSTAKNAFPVICSRRNLSARGMKFM